MTMDQGSDTPRVLNKRKSTGFRTRAFYGGRGGDHGAIRS
jgi:hypothetical protein